MRKIPRIWKENPFRSRLQSSKTQQLSVALISRNPILRNALVNVNSPCGQKYNFDMFTTVHGHNLAFHDIILLDNGLNPFTVEEYMTRFHAKKHIPFRPSSTAPEHHRTPPIYPQSRPFPDFAALYDDLDFPAYAETTERLLTRANAELAKWKSHLLNEGGFTAIRVKNPITNKFVPKRCVLLPATVLTEWKYEVNTIAKLMLDFSLPQFPVRRFLRKCELDETEMQKLFYVKAIGVQNPERKKFLDVPFWKMNVMLKKWRTDRALEEWSARYQR